MSTPSIPDEVLNRVRNLQEGIDQLQANINAIEQQSNLISSVIGSLNDSITTQNELKSKERGDEILVPIGGSNFILCTIKDPQKTFISLGSGVTLLTELKDSKERNKNQIENLENGIKRLQEQYSKFTQQLNISRQELIQILQEYQIYL